MSRNDSSFAIGSFGCRFAVGSRLAKVAGDRQHFLKRGSPKVLDGTVISQWGTDDTLPGGPRAVERIYVAPFALANREDDYRAAWAFIE